VHNAYKSWINSSTTQGSSVEIRQLKYFLAVVDAGSLSRAAQQVFVAQSALSKQMAELEVELGVQLLNRSRSGVSATEAGQVFYDYALAIQKQIQDARAAVHCAPDAVVGAVVLAIPQSVSGALALPLMRAAKQRLPQINLQVNEELTGNLLEQLRQGKVDIGIFTPNLEAADFSFEPLVQEAFCLLRSPQDTRFAASGALSLAQAASSAMVMPSALHGQCTRVFVEKALAAHGLAPLQIAAEINSAHILKSAVEAGQGTTLMPMALAAQELLQKRLVAHPIAPEVLQRTLGLCMSTHIPITRAKRAVRDLIGDVAKQVCADGVWPGAVYAGAR
jgi:LysR family transcriptional regulator, nitrogen assimilation regulatory protein